MKNNYNEVKQLLMKLCAVSGPSGCEGCAAEAAKELLAQYMPVHTDALGSVIGEQEGEGGGILLDAHLDQIGLIVTAVDDNGFIKVAKCGGADARVLAAAQVTVHGKKPLFGVVTSTPPHLSKDGDSKKAKDFDDIAVDIGFGAEQARELVSPGDRITFNGSLKSMLNDCVSSPSIDDRAGVAAVLRCLELLRGTNHGRRLAVMFSAQEETGGSGAKAGSYSCKAAQAIAVDVSFAWAPGVSKEKYASLGGGAMIGIAPSLDENMSSRLIELAKKNNIDYQLEVMGGRTGTNCDEIQLSRGGIKTALISVPLRNMHTAAELVSLADIESTARLMAAYIAERGACDA